MSRNTLNAQFNKTVHDEDTDSESALRAQHAALAKMASMPDPVQPPSPVAPLAAPPAPIAAPPHAVLHPAFHGIINAIRKPKAGNTMRIASPPKVLKV